MPSQEEIKKINERKKINDGEREIEKQLKADGYKLFKAFDVVEVKHKGIQQTYVEQEKLYRKGRKEVKVVISAPANIRI